MVERYAVLVFCLISFGVAPNLYAADTSSSTLDESVLQEARALLDAENYSAAKAILREANSATPGNSDVLNLLGYAFRQADQLGDAAIYYAQALEVDPNHRGALEYQGELYLLLDRPEKAKANLARLAELCARNCEEYEDLAEELAAYEAR